MTPRDFTAADIASIDWSGHEGAKPRVRCVRGRSFISYAKFSGALGALVSKDPCPVCHIYDMQAAHYGPEYQTISKEEVRDV